MVEADEEGLTVEQLSSSESRSIKSRPARAGLRGAVITATFLEAGDSGLGTVDLVMTGGGSLVTRGSSPVVPGLLYLRTPVGALSVKWCRFSFVLDSSRTEALLLDAVESTVEPRLDRADRSFSCLTLVLCIANP